MPRTPGSPLPRCCTGPTLAITAGRVLHNSRKPEKVARGSLKQDRHKSQTDLTAPCTVELTEPTPVVANHAVEKVSHGPPRCPGDTPAGSAALRSHPGTETKVWRKISIPGRRSVQDSG